MIIGSYVLPAWKPPVDAKAPCRLGSIATGGFQSTPDQLALQRRNGFFER
jgi:hypothetical protein